MPPKKIYDQKFRKEWLTDPICKDWIQAEIGEPNRAYCRICRNSIKAKFSDIKKHVESKKHQKRSINRKDFALEPVDQKGIIPPAYENELEEEPHSPKIILGIEHPTLGESPKQMVSKVMQAADGTSIVIQSRDDLFKCDNRNTGEINSITELVTSVFQKDLARLLRKDATLRKLALSRSYYEGKEGRAKLTKTLVGHLSLHYLTEFNDTKEPEVNIVSHLHDIKQQIQKSVDEMKSMTAQMVHKESVQQHTHSEETSMIMIQDS